MKPKILPSGSGPDVVGLFPESTTINVEQRHWLFWWNIHHIRSVLAEPELVGKGNELRFEVAYTNLRTGIRLINKNTAERYLGRAIIEPWYAGEAYQEKKKTVFTHTICEHEGCRRICGEKRDMIFRGPFFSINNPINITVDFPCPHCGWSNPTDISTEPSSDLAPTSDCDWLDRPVVFQVQKAK